MRTIENGELVKFKLNDSAYYWNIFHLNVGYTTSEHRACIGIPIYLLCVCLFYFSFRLVTYLHRKIVDLPLSSSSSSTPSLSTISRQAAPFVVSIIGSSCFFFRSMWTHFSVCAYLSASKIEIQCLWGRATQSLRSSWIVE